MQSVSCQVCQCSQSSCESCNSPAECTNCFSCCCADLHKSWRRSRIQIALLLEYFSVGWMAVEVFGSIAAGLLAGSLALLAFGGDSIVELISASVVAYHLRKDAGGSLAVGKKTTFLSSALLFSLIPVIGFGALYSYVIGIRPESSLLGLAIAVGAVVIMPILWVEKERIGRETKCLPLAIDAMESATCFLMSVALLGGLLVNYFFRIGWADYVATAVILGFVAKEAVESLHEIREMIS